MKQKGLSKKVVAIMAATVLVVASSVAVAGPSSGGTGTGDDSVIAALLAYLTKSR